MTKYFGGLAAVLGVSLSVSQGEILGLVGPNGAGKTTVLNLIGGHYRPDQGKVTFQGQDVTGQSAFALCKLGIGRTFQTPRPFRSMTALENVAIGAMIRTRNVARAEKTAMAVLERVNLGHKAHALASGLTIADRKRLEVARALATEPALLLLDEVMAGLTPTEVNDAIGIVRSLKESGITIIMIEHVMQAVMALSDRVVVLHHGEVLANGTPRAVTSDPRVIEAYLGDEYGIA
jgi:branched-chain amino acid transport system ATP-binding protein